MAPTNNENNRTNPGYFGSGVIGKELYDAEQEVVKAGGDIFGPGVTGVGLPTAAVNLPGPGVTGQVPGQVPAVPMLSVRALEEALQASPLLVDTFLPGELNRPGGPRKGALEALEIAERSRPGGEREEVLAQITDALTAEPPKEPAESDSKPEE